MPIAMILFRWIRQNYINSVLSMNAKGIVPSIMPVTIIHFGLLWCGAMVMIYYTMRLPKIIHSRYN